MKMIIENEQQINIKRAKAVLLGCMFLGLFSEILLAPFYPQFFSKVFGIQDYSYTGMYIFICRLVVVIISPVWGLLAKYIDAKKLLYIGQAGTALFTAMMAFAESAQQFLLITVCLLLFKSSYMLIYPLIIELSGHKDNASSVASFHAVYHASIICATLVGGWMIGLSNPISLFFYAAMIDVVQLILCILVFRGFNHKPKKEESQPVLPNKKLFNGFIVLLGVLFFTIMIISNVIRPFFTVYTEELFKSSLMVSSILYLIPSVMAIIAMPFIKRFCSPTQITKTYLVSIFLLAVSLLMQSISESIYLFLIGRMLFGFCFILCMASLDIAMFNWKKGGIHLNFSIIVSFQTVGELVSPILASFLVKIDGLVMPLLVASMICVVNGFLFMIFRKIMNAEQHQNKWIEKELYSRRGLNGEL
ncbi:MFS transporter [Metabacillus fastidiosus]|uniref:MFS transporter n=1 Tax=Metabacillus fastidiosus TaxID=1458 RepID=UPI003D2A7071